MTHLWEYGSRYRSIRMEREDGVLVVTLHRDGGPFVFDEPTHHELGAAFDAISDDPENKVVVLTGSGDRFCTDVDYDSFAANRRADPDAHWMRLRRDGDRMLRAFVDIEVPVVSSINGPVLTHSELPVMADVVLAADTTVFQDSSHFLIGLPPGDGMHTVWSTLLGINRARYFLMTGQTITVDAALQLGVVSEVLPMPEVLPRALEIARSWALLPDWTLRNTRALLNQRWRRALAEELHSGLSYEALASLRLPQAPGHPSPGQG